MTTKEKKILPMPVGTHLSQVKRGKNKGKFVVYGMEGVQNSLKRFADQTLYLIVDDPEAIIGRCYSERHTAEEWLKLCHNMPEHSKDFIKEITLTADQIVR